MPDWNDESSRCRFLTLMGASIALAGASGCNVMPERTIVPYVRQLEDFVPGRARELRVLMIFRDRGRSAP